MSDTPGTDGVTKGFCTPDALASTQRMDHGAQRSIIAIIKGLLGKPLVRYTAISIFVALIDMCVSRLTENFLPLLLANTAGIVTGFLIQFLLTARFVYHKRNQKSFLVFFGTFLLGLLAANAIVWFSRTALFQNSDAFIPFLVSKGLSIVLPFFGNYFLRRKLIERC